ncbi:MAG: tRNA (N(6)-L-threonylcarbamoyladenosine(37)-C(2))-methylthiotransferase MtaB [Bdellovibrionaceae bacterium]|nr:tRNA (N(6)-L-threonylcarbamoyladenosine(37)-C(2))-methylthiotransferase MtaB [Pseudobdellovibrionaceae bacterium]
MNSRYNFVVHSYGCKVNTYDTGLLQKRLERAGFQQRVDKPAVHIFNTCAVTAEATRGAIKDARRVRAREPLATIVMTGCSAQVDGAQLDHLPGVDLVVANSHKGELESLLDRYFRGELRERVFRSNIFRKEDLEAGGGVEAGHTRTFLKIQDGCNSFCSYCVIPYARGKSRSIPIRELVGRIRELHAQGIGEVVLTGVHIGDYEDSEMAQERPRDLSALVEAVLEQTAIERVRLSSLEPVELNERLLALFANERLCRHFHMSIQAANTRVLQAMKRQYSAEDVEWALTAIAERVPGSFVGMDVIAGFPGETDEEFEDTYGRLERLPWTRIHVFPYSERPGTKAAALMADAMVPKHVRAARAARLRELSSERFARAALTQVGQVKAALILNTPAHGAQALTRDYWPVQIEGAESMVLRPGHEILVRVTGYDHSNESRMDGGLVGRPLES